jgi:hypothetical protein
MCQMNMFIARSEGDSLKVVEQRGHIAPVHWQVMRRSLAGHAETTNTQSPSPDAFAPGEAMTRAALWGSDAAMVW